MTAHLSLRYSMPMVLGVLGLALVLIAFYDGKQRSEELIETEASAQLLTFGTRIAATLEQLYAEGRQRELDDVLSRTTSEPHLRNAAVVDPRGNIVESADSALVGKSLSDFKLPWATETLQRSIATGHAIASMDSHGENLSAIFPFSLPAERGELRSHRYAAVYLHADLLETKRLNLARHVERAWWMSAVVALALVLVWGYFHWAVTTRLALLSAAMQRVTLGDLSDRAVGVSGRDELGRLGQGFAQMLGEIGQRRKALAASEARYRSIIYSMSEGVVTLDAQGRIVTVNESIARIAGLSLTQFQERTAFDPRWTLFFEDGRPMPVEENPVARSIRGGQSLRDVVLGIRRQDGALRWVTTSCEPLLLDAADGAEGKPGVLVIVADITERRAAELQAIRDRERLVAIVGSAMDGVICMDANMRITLFNRAAELIFGYPEAQMLGQKIDALLPVRYRNGHQELVQQFTTTATTKRSMGMPGEVAGLRAGGEEFPLEASISRVALGNEIVLTVILRDLSERKRAEAQREQLEAQLRQSQKLQSLGTLTGGIAHDFNNILTAISGNAKLAQLELQETNLTAPFPVRRSLAEIEKAAARATDLVRQVLTFSRRQEAQRVAVDLTSVVADALKFLRAMIPAMIEIRSQLPAGLPLVAIDSTQIHQVITNLGTNAAHAIGERAGAIDVKLEDIEIAADQLHVSADLHAGRYVRLTFSDTGGGIDPKVLDHIFEPFFTTKDLGQGTGLGLSVVHGIMKNHDGAIAVHSERYVGTRFELYFPVSVQPLVVTRGDAAQGVEQQPYGTGKTIIYIDDEEALVFLVTRILERRGYRVLGFTAPAAALVELGKHPTDIDALVSDLAMPGMTGFDVARAAHELRPDLPVILVSGYVRPQDLEQARRLGVRQLILKPDTVDGLGQALHEILCGQDVTCA